jgi:hypothetical protein
MEQILVAPEILVIVYHERAEARAMGPSSRCRLPRNGVCQWFPGATVMDCGAVG